MLQGRSTREAQKPALEKLSEMDRGQIISSTIDCFFFYSIIYIYILYVIYIYIIYFYSIITSVPPKSVCSQAGAVVITEVQSFSHISTERLTLGHDDKLQPIP